MRSPASLLLPLLLGVTPARAGLEGMREVLSKDPAQAAAQLSAELGRHPEDPWLLYNSGVACYAAKDFARADEAWQKLAATPMPDALRDQVWLQIGNVSYRLVEGQIEKEPDLAVARLEQSREAFRVALAFNKKNQAAGGNLLYVEQELAKVYTRLAQRLAAEAKKEGSLPKAIEKLEAALTYAEQAQAVQPQDKARQAVRQEIEQELAQKLEQRAAQEEKTADQRNPEDQWQRKDAQERLRNALADLQKAQALNQESPTAKEGEKRVEHKLAELFNQAARREQKQALQLAQNQPEPAVEKFQQALEDFQAAQAIQPEHEDAKKGEAEVKEQLAQLDLAQGDQQAKQGEQQAKNNPQPAAENLLRAMENFEAAKALEPENREIQPRIDKVAAQLPELLNKVAQQQQQQGAAAEKRNQENNALQNYEKAEASFAKAEQLAPENQTAKEGRQQTQDALARLRQQLAQKAEQKGQPTPNGKGQPPPESFESMLAKLKDDLKNKEANARPHAGQKYNQERDQNLRNW